MSVQSDDQELDLIVADTLSVRNFGPLENLTIATAMHFPGSTHCPKIVFGPETKKMSLFDMDENMFMYACTLSSMTAEGFEPQAIFHGEDVWLDDSHRIPWNQTMNTVMIKLLKHHGFQGDIKWSLRGLSIIGQGIRSEIHNPSYGRNGGYFASVLIDLPFTYSGGDIDVTREGFTQTFTFSTSSNVNLSFLHWFHDSTVSMQPITRGFRACLLYDVFINPATPRPLALVPGSARMQNIEAHVQSLVLQRSFLTLHPKTHFMPLIRTLVYTYRSSHMATPAPCLEFYYHVVKSYRMKIQDAMNAGNQASLSDVYEEGREIISSFGGKTAMQCLLGHRYVNGLIASIENLRQ